MTTFIEQIPKFTTGFGEEAFALTPSGKEGNTFQDGYVRTEWFENVFGDIANAELPLPVDKYDKLKNIGECWAINAINWRKDSVIEVDGIPADQQIEEEEAFLLEMYPPAPEPEQTPEEGTEQAPETEEIPAEETETAPDQTEEAAEPTPEATPETEQTTEEA